MIAPQSENLKPPVSIINMLLQNQDPVALREEIQKIMVDNGFKRECYTKILDYTVNLFESKGLGIDYYGYHNIIHELEVTYVTLLAAQWESTHGILKPEDFPYLFVAALFHDYDPQKKVDKPHEEDAVKFVMTDEKLDSFLKDANIDKNLIAALIHRTTYPWSGELKETTEKKIEDCLNLSRLQETTWKKGSISRRWDGFSQLQTGLQGIRLVILQKH